MVNLFNHFKSSPSKNICKRVFCFFSEGRFSLIWFSTWEFCLKCDTSSSNSMCPRCRTMLNVFASQLLMIILNVAIVTRFVGEFCRRLELQQTMQMSIAWKYHTWSHVGPRVQHTCGTCYLWRGGSWEVAWVYCTCSASPAQIFAPDHDQWQQYQNMPKEWKRSTQRIKKNSAFHTTKCLASHMMQPHFGTNRPKRI